MLLDDEEDLVDGAVALDVERAERPPLAEREQPLQQVVERPDARERLDEHLREGVRRVPERRRREERADLLLVRRVVAERRQDGVDDARVRRDEERVEVEVRALGVSGAGGGRARG